ncbi:MAG: DUF1570 domain-containing protein [Pirellulales bacterium]|nr:DUF1570 domain-containing protein [Pirellulales bacterium]
MKQMVFFLLIFFPAFSLAAADQAVFRRDGREQVVTGRLLAEAQDGGLLLLAPDARIWAIMPKEKIEHTHDAIPFQPLNREELSQRLLAKLPPGFNTFSTAHYLICYDTSRAYAQWCGALFERLHAAFMNFWRRKGLELQPPEFPLVAVLFADQKEYLQFTRDELGDLGGSIVAFYSLMSNRMTLFDLTGIETSGRPVPRNTAQQINQILAQPGAQQTVATLVHEATHQIAFNCGLHARLSDCPLWVSEGIAMYFETPDLRSAKGWSGIGAVNRPRLNRFAEYLHRRPADSLATLIETDRRFHNLEQSLDAYAEAWALTYFLLRRHPKEYVEYLKILSEKKPLIMDTPKERRKEFEKAFGKLGPLETEFHRFISKLR